MFLCPSIVNSLTLKAFFLMYKFILLLILFVSSVLNAQDLSLLKSFGVNDPMSYQFVRTISQDKDGFMWFGSQEGLHRYDGYQFLSFHHDVGEPNSLSSDLISRILVDRKQQLWVATRGTGLNLYRENTQDFMHISTKTENAKLSDDNVNALFEDSKGNLWIGTENGLNILSFKGNKWKVTQIFQELGNPESLTHNTVQAIVESDNKTIWVGTTGGGISVFDLNGGFVKSYRNLNDGKDSTKGNLINALYKDKQGVMWIGTVESGLIKYQPKDETFIVYQFDKSINTSLTSNTVEAIYQDSNGAMWIATDKGLLIYNAEENNFKRYNHSASNPYSLTNDYVLTFFEDSDQMMWIGTYSGVSRWNPNITTFSQFSDLKYPEITSGLITSFTQKKENQLIFSTYNGGIYQLSVVTNKIDKYDFDNFFKDLRITTLFYENETLWVGTRASGLYKVNLNNKKIIHYKNDNQNEESISANSITDVIKDKNGSIWISTYHQGLNRLNSDGSFTRFTQGESITDTTLSSNHVVQLLEDRKGNIWIATYGGGLNRLDTKTEKILHFKHDDNILDSISSDLAWIIFEDSNENLWIGTQTEGFNILSKENLDKDIYSFSHLNVKDGMNSRAVYGIIQDDSGDIWFSSNKGISRFSPKHKAFKHFDKSHGLIDVEYNHGTVFKDINNKLYFGSAKSFISVNPKNVSNNKLAPKVRLTNILKLNEPMVFNQSLSTLSSLTFDYSDQLISFEYVGLNFSDPESTSYKYRLLGFDQEWIDAGKSRRATYTNLPAGSYTLQIIAGNNDNVWSEPGVSLNISVNPAPWNTWWAYLLYAIAVASILLVYSRFLNRKLLVEQQQKSYLKEQVKDKTQKLQSQNSELEHANKLLEKSATVDKITGVRSRRYLDIYIEQTSQLMNQIHLNILPVQRSTLPRLYVLMVQINELTKVSNSQLINITDLLLFSRNTDDLVVRWSDDTFAVIGYEKENNASELASRLANKFVKQFDQKISMNVAYSFYPFNREQPMDISWDQVSVMIELGLKLTNQDNTIAWLGLCQPKIHPFSYLEVIQGTNLAALKHNIHVKQG
jgi:ligand-binding sensor domain-containing protein/GGDEF domain-containing protein